MSLLVLTSRGVLFSFSRRSTVAFFPTRRRSLFWTFLVSYVSFSTLPSFFLALCCTALLERMLELARQGAGWLHDYEGWGVGSSAPVVEEGQEMPQVLRHLHSTGDDPREVRAVEGGEDQRR